MSIEGWLDRFNRKMLVISTGIVAVCDSHSFLTTGTMDTSLYWTNIALVAGFTLQAWQISSDDRQKFERWSRQQ